MTDYSFLIEPQAVREFALTETQQKVVALSANSRVVVHGSPGSGKTTALIHLAQRLIKGEAAPLHSSQLLALAASREAANLLRDDLALAFQGATAGPLARTLASFAFQILRHHALANGIKPPELISGSEQDRMLKEIVDALDEQALLAQGWPQHINAQVATLKGFRGEVRDLITVCQEYRVTPQELRDLGVAHSRNDWVAAANLLEQYLQKLREPEMQNRHDSATLLDVAADLLESGEGFTPEIANIKTVLVDDAQELTPSARRLLKAIVSRGAGLVLFGDPDTATLGFRAADPRSMATLMSEIGATSEPISLQIAEGLRKPQLASALGNISSNLPSELSGLQRRDYTVARSELGGDQVIEGHLFASPLTEVAWLGRRLRELHVRDKIKWSEIAIVARSRVTLEALASGLSSEEVPVAIRGSRSALRDEFASGELLFILDCVMRSTPLEVSEVRRLLASPFCGLDSLGLRRLRRALRRQELEADGQRTTDELLLELFAAEGAASTIDSYEGKLVAGFVKVFFDARNQNEAGASIEDLLWKFWSFGKGADRPRKMWQELATEAGEVGAQMNRNLDAVVALFGAANRFVERNPNSPASVFVAEQLALELPEDTLSLNYRDDDRVALLTPSGLIGKRFKVVILPRLQDGLWPNLKPRTSLLGARLLDALKSGRAERTTEVDRNELFDELRMLHKAVGAADDKLIITAVDAEEEQASSFVRTLLTKVPEELTEFKQTRLTLRGLVADLRRRLVTTEDKHQKLSFAYALARLAYAEIPGASPRDWFGLLDISSREPLVDDGKDDDEQVYLRPSQLEAFLTCPLHWFLENHGGSDRSFEASLGTLLHSVLEREGEQSEEQLWQIIEERWGELEFEAEWLSAKEKRRAQRMFQAMMAYLRDPNIGTVLGREVEFEFEYNGAIIKGTVDRIEERIVDGEKKIVIVDLKTGKKVTKAEARLHPQLGVYQLAVQQGAFAHLGIDKDTPLDGARLLFVNEGEKPALMDQPSFSDDKELKAQIEAEVTEATTEMAMPRLVFDAKVASHCEADRSFGNCKIHLAKAVSFVG